MREREKKRGRDTGQIDERGNKRISPNFSFTLVKEILERKEVITCEKRERRRKRKREGER